MWKYPKTYDVIVVGAGHAGSEAARAAASMGADVLLITMNLDTIGKMSCNPSIGGTAKGHMVREIDALGGLMGKIADETGIQFRMLNASKGPAVRSPRAQVDKAAYALAVKEALENTPGLEIHQGTIERLLVEKQTVVGLLTKEGISYFGKTVVLSSGTFLRGLLHIGETQFSGGRSGDKASQGLSPFLESQGFRLARLKTGTPPRIHAQSIDFDACEVQHGDEGVHFSFDLPKKRLPQVPCHITYTTLRTKELVQKNLHRSPLYAGTIKGVGPRYCPSIEDKVVRFAEKERHQIFLEPEGIQTREVYVNGISSSLPFDVQFEMIRSVTGLEKAQIMRPAYAIEYDYVTSDQILPSLETKRIENLFLAGQINGTTGYEEAAAQGLLAGINAASKAANRSALILSRSAAYIGVMIDDLIRFELNEPYRMFTSRAEYRLLLRQDNADLRLHPIAYEYGLISRDQFLKTQRKQSIILSEISRLATCFTSIEGKSVSLSQLICRPEWSYLKTLEAFPLQLVDFGTEINEQIELHIKYAGYIERQQKEINKLGELEAVRIPSSFCYNEISGLRKEACEKLSKFTPTTLGQASRMFGISPSDVSILRIALEKSRNSVCK